MPFNIGHSNRIEREQRLLFPWLINLFTDPPCRAIYFTWEHGSESGVFQIFFLAKENPVQIKNEVQRRVAAMRRAPLDDIKITKWRHAEFL